jgi:hypothetical protein
MRAGKMLRPLVLAIAALLVPACSSDEETAPAPATPAATVAFDPSADFRAENGFFDFPFPSDLRLDAKGAPDVDAFPDPGVVILAGLKKGAQERKGFPVMPVGYFRLTAKPAVRDRTKLIEGGKDASIVLVDVDPASPVRGATFPVVADTPNPDRYAPEWLLAIAPRPGIVLAPSRKYAFFIKKDVGLEGGGELTPAAKMESDEKVKASLAPLWETLAKIGVDKANVAAATVFTTGDVVASTSELGDKVLAAHQPSITDLVLEADPENKRPSMCHLRGSIVMPQFQRGTAPFDTEGLFEFGADGVPVKQRDETLNVSIALPRTAMPEAGYPLVIYIHGSGGRSRQFVDGGGDDENDGKSTWPGVTLTERDFAVAGTAMPISPERVPGVTDYAYVNPDNFIALRDTFRQGIFETRMLASALEKLRIPAATLTGCPTAQTTGEIKFAPELHIQGQSMGGMYTNLVGASDPRFKVVVPTGGGGHWLYFLIETNYIENAAGLLAVVLKTSERLTFMHPAMQIGATAIEAVDPIVSANRLAKRPLAGHPARHVYAPQGKGDSYFTTEVYDAITLSYGSQRAGDEIWPSMHEAQKLVGTDAVAPYPVKSNITSENGSQYTGVVVQYEDPTFAPHQIYRRLPAVQHQFGCFHQSFRKTGVAVVPAPGPTRDSPCAE